METVRCSRSVLEKSHKWQKGTRCGVRNYLAFHWVYPSGIMGRLWVAYAIENRSVFWLRVGVSDPKIEFTNGLNDS
jgi:hypothetical protein